ncbi:uncharacterized protein VTP21DRAFT_9363 [Calcarisporiella thermophila]|uniref:uncharacterized protein n=1 Tax=Calcarisporiella thermophila TaxID=911321 RepID=UPI0037439429
MLRRKPTRIELRQEDVHEFENLRRELIQHKQQQAEQQLQLQQKDDEKSHIKDLESILEKRRLKSTVERIGI